VDARRALVERLRTRLPDLEAAALARIYSIQGPDETSDPEYAQGLRDALRTALDFGLISIEVGEDKVPGIPIALVAQARMAARSGVGLDTVLRRYLAGYSLLTDFAIKEAEDADFVDPSVLQKILRDQAVVVDRLLEVVSAEHCRETSERSTSNEKRKAERVKRLLAGEPIDPAPLNYDLGGSHIGLVAKGPAARELVRSLADRFDKRLLRVRCDEMTVWGWLGAPAAEVRRDEVSEVLDVARSFKGEDVLAAFGEVGFGSSGWRLTHRQAQAALCVLDSGNAGIGRYRDVALLASIRNDDLLAASLKSIYLAPLAGERNAVLRENLRAYFSASRNVSSAAAILGVKRHTVTKRLRIAEEKLGFTITKFPVEMEAALRLEQVDPPSSMAPAASGGGHIAPPGH